LDKLEPLSLVFSIRDTRQLRDERPGKLAELERAGDARQVHERPRDAQKVEDLRASVVKGRIRVGGNVWKAELSVETRFMHRAQGIDEAAASSIARGVRRKEDLVKLFGGDAWGVIERAGARLVAESCRLDQ